jgi:hypothetical protein
MRRRFSRATSIAAGTVLVAPVLALLAGATASADDLVTIGPFDISGYTDTLTYDSSALSFDNYLVGTLGAATFDLDAYEGALGTNNSEYVFTIPLLFQAGIDDVDGTVTPFYSFDAFDFVSPDAGLVNLGGIPSTEGIVTIGPFAFDGITDTLSADASGAFDSYVVGSLGSLTYDLDAYVGAPGSNSAEVLFTIPSLLQVGFDDVDGVITPLSSFAAVDALNPDIGLLDLAAALG